MTQTMSTSLDKQGDRINDQVQ